MSVTTPKLGIALSGAAARSAFYVGFLEVLEEHGLRPNIITAQSGAALVAASYACGTLPRFKKEMLKLNWKTFKPLLRRAPGEGGFYTLDGVEEYFRNNFTHHKQFRDIDIRLCFMATNLNSGELVSLAVGDIAHAARITCGVPALFTPMKWGSQLLIDGGLLSVLPGQQAREAGADVVVGVSVRASKHIFHATQIAMKSKYNDIRDKVFAPVRKLRSITRKYISPEGLEYYLGGEVQDRSELKPSMLKIVSRSLDLAVSANKQSAQSDGMYGCDMVVTEGVGSFGDSVSFSKFERLYVDGRRSAEQNISRIRAMLDGARG